jgi:hypothetical protein
VQQLVLAALAKQPSQLLLQLQELANYAQKNPLGTRRVRGDDLNELVGGRPANDAVFQHPRVCALLTSTYRSHGPEQMRSLR